MDRNVEFLRTRGYNPSMKRTRFGIRHNRSLGQAAATSEGGQPAVWPSTVVVGGSRTQWTTETSKCRLIREAGGSCSFPAK